MSPTTRSTSRDATRKSRRGTEESPFVKWLLIGVSLVFVLMFLFLPLLNVFAQALAKGWGGYWHSLHDADTLAAIRLTLLVAAITVPFNAAFGIAASWAIASCSGEVA